MSILSIRPATTNELLSEAEHLDQPTQFLYQSHRIFVVQDAQGNQLSKPLDYYDARATLESFYLIS